MKANRPTGKMQLVAKPTQHPKGENFSTVLESCHLPDSKAVFTFL
jgi:hypothetical protein